MLFGGETPTLPQRFPKRNPVERIGTPAVAKAKTKKKRRPEGALQTVLVKKKLATTRKGAKQIVRGLKRRTYTIRETKGEWRLRQRPPDCFVPGTYGTKCFDRFGVKRGVCMVFATLKKGAKRRKACR